MEQTIQHSNQNGSGGGTMTTGNSFEPVVDAMHRVVTKLLDSETDQAKVLSRVAPKAYELHLRVGDQKLVRRKAVLMARHEAYDYITGNVSCWRSCALFPQADENGAVKIPRLVQDSLQQLNHNEQEALVMYYIRRANISDIAKALGVSDEDVLPVLKMATYKLRRELVIRGACTSFGVPKSI